MAPYGQDVPVTLRPATFAHLLQQWLTDALHPGINRVRTCAAIGWVEQPCGVHIATADGWALLLQVVRTSPAGGDQPAGEDEVWSEPAYRAARVVFDAEAHRPGVKPTKPRASVSALLDVVVTAVWAGGYPEAAVCGGVDGRPVLAVTTTDGATLFGLPAGWFAPGAVALQHPAHQIPADWY